MTIAKKFTLLLWVFLLPVVHVFSQCTPTNLGSSQVISTNTTWSSGTYNINGDFTVNAGVTLTISYNPNNCPFIVNATNITILGTINADGAGGRGGAGGAGGGSSGGAGGGSLAAGGGAGGPGSGAGGGTPGSAGGTASGGCGIDCGNVVCAGGNDADRAGAGGAGGGAGGSFGGSGGSGDAGAAGRIENEPGNSNCGSAPVAGTAGGGNAAPVAYGNTAINNDLASGSGGAGGGGGGGGFSGGTAGSAGGNGGGSVNLNASADLVVSGIISASGTNGSVGGNGGDRSGAGNWNCETCSNADGGGGNDCRDASQCGVCTYYTWGWPGGGGGGSGGGSGGGIKVQAKGNMNLTGTLLANGGGGGGAGHPFQSDASCNHIAGAGGPGAGGVIKYVYNPCASNVFSPAAAQGHAGFTGTTGTGALDTNTGSNGTVLDETADIYIPGFSPVPAPVAANNQLLCGPGHAPAAISANGISGGTGSYTYQWYASTANANGQTGSNSTAAPGFNIITGATGTVLNSVFTGTLSQTTYYQMKVVSGPCTGWSNVVTVTVAPLPSISVAENDVLCNGGSTGSLTLTASSGTPAYTYSNDGGANYQSSNVFGSLTAGNYTLSVKDVNNCSATYASNPAVVAEPAALSMTDVPVNASCTNIANGSVTVTVVTGGVSPYQYSLNGGGNQSSNAFNNLPQADYLVQVTDNNGCTDTMTAIVSNSYSVSASLDATTDVSCFGGSNGMATVSMTGGVTPYLYSSDGSTFQTTPTLTGYSAGSFTATIKDDNGCIATVPVQIAQPTQLVVQIDSATTVPCNSSALGNIYSSTTGGVPGYTFLWNNNATDSNLTSLIAGTYTITATDNNSCTASATGAITVVSNFTTTASAIATTCFGSSDGSAFVVVNSGTGPFGYTWTSGATTDTVIGLAAGIVSVTVTDVNSCPSTATVTVNQPTAVTAQATAIQPTCAGANDGQAIASANGGTPTYSFAWSNSTSTDTASGLAPGSYSVTVLDANSCSATATASITDPTPISASLLVTGDSCSGQQNGSVQVSATGGTGLYTYAWSNSATGGYVNNLAAGTYTVTTSDSHNCSVTSSAVITSPDPLQIFTSSTGDLNGQGTGTATVDSVSGGTPPYFITGWSNGESVNPIVGLATGSYTVTVVDHHGCEQTATVTVSFISGITTTGKNDLSFDVYPNPAKTEINISLNDISREGVLNVSVKDVLGHTLLTKTLATPQTKVDISTLANGVYMVELKRGDKKVVKQIVVNK